MALLVRLAKPASGHHLKSRILLIVLAACTVAALVGFCVFSVLYFKYQRIVDARLQQPIFANTAKIYAAPREVRPGQKLTIHWIANELRDAGYTPGGASQASQLGTFSEGCSRLR